MGGSNPGLAAGGAAAAAAAGAGPTRRLIALANALHAPVRFHSIQSLLATGQFCAGILPARFAAQESSYSPEQVLTEQSAAGSAAKLELTQQQLAGMSVEHDDHHGYVLRGLWGLANAVPRAGSMAGHLGAATVTGALMVAGLECEFEPSVRPILYANLDRIMAGEEKWFNEQAAGVTTPELFIPLQENEQTQPVASALVAIANALRRNIGGLRQSGHNVIFASIAMRALVQYPSYCTPGLVSGIVKLISSFDGAVAGQGLYSASSSAPSSEGLGPGRLFGHDAPLALESETPPNGAPYQSIDNLVQVTIEELVRSAAEHRQGFGGLHHLINHAAALVVLSETGYPELAATGMSAHWHHLRLYRALPNLEKELGALRCLEIDPRSFEYWKIFGSGQWSAALTHSIKTLYGFSVLLRHHAAHCTPQDTGGDHLRQRARSAFGYLMA